jgi:hypothetical protein
MPSAAPGLLDGVRENPAQSVGGPKLTPGISENLIYAETAAVARHLELDARDNQDDCEPK